MRDLVDEQVLGLEVAVQHVVAVTEGNAAEQLTHEPLAIQSRDMFMINLIFMLFLCYM